MSLTDRLLATLIAALAAWIVTSVVSHFIKRSRLRAALIADIGLHIGGAKEQRSAVARLVGDHVKVGGTMPFPISYNVGEYLLYKSLQRDLPEYLHKTELVNVVKFYHALWELDVSINALAESLSQWEKATVSFTTEHVVHIQRRKERIDSLCEMVTAKEIKELSDLPSDYRSVKGPDSVLGKP